MVDVLPNSVSARTLANQIARSGTSVAANYRAACRAKSKADFISKLGTVEEEADETLFWLEMIKGANSCPPLVLPACTRKPASWLPSPSVRSTPLGETAAIPNSEIRNTQFSFRNPQSAIRIHNDHSAFRNPKFAFKP